MSQSSKRVPVGVAPSRPRKRVSGRTSAAETPLALRTSGIGLTPELREHVLGRMGWRLGKFARHIERLTVRFEDVNGPRGGVDTVCRIKVVLSGHASVVVEELASGPFEAFNRADDRVERAVRRAIGRAQGRGRLTGVRAPRRAPAVAKPRAAARRRASHLDGDPQRQDPQGRARRPPPSRRPPPRGAGLASRRA